MFPARFATGVGNRTIPNPTCIGGIEPMRKTRVLERSYRHHPAEIWSQSQKMELLSSFEGLCKDYDFRFQTKNYKALREVLLRNNTDFLYVAGIRYRGTEGTNHRFVATSVDGSLLWNKYVGMAPMSGQNHVYVAGIRIKVSVFLGLKPKQQDALISGSWAAIKTAISGSQLSAMNESSSLWN